jgi:hypothetical protein
MPHQCDQCKGPIETATGAWASTIVCTHEGCGQVTSMYALLYRCLACGQRLETPRRVDGQETAGSETVCPGCGQPLRVPFGPLERDDGRPGTPEEYGFRCVHCRRGIRARRTQARRLGVCPHCYKPMEVPLAGYSLSAAPLRTGDPREVLPAATVHCPRCREEIPKAAASCPFCGDVLPGTSHETGDVPIPFAEPDMTTRRKPDFRSLPQAAGQDASGVRKELQERQEPPTAEASPARESAGKRLVLQFSLVDDAAQGHVLAKIANLYEALNALHVAYGGKGLIIDEGPAAVTAQEPGGGR